MTTLTQSLGGKATAILLRNKAIEGYYKNPNICLECNEIIQINEGEKVSEIKRKQFCNRQCAAIFHNRKRKKPKIRIDKREERLKATNKKELFENCINYFSARSTITKIAKSIIKRANIERKCSNCGYDKHVEVCHIKAVSDFENMASLYDINGIHNLIYLCPNCHWEFDNKLLQINYVEREGFPAKAHILMHVGSTPTSATKDHVLQSS